MTESQIERRVERAFDRLDERLIAGLLSQQQYDDEAARIRDWADREFDRANRWG